MNPRQTTRVNRRRRRRSARHQQPFADDGDPPDQVQALKGSTRQRLRRCDRRGGRRERSAATRSRIEFLARPQASVEHTTWSSVIATAWIESPSLEDRLSLSTPSLVVPVLHGRQHLLGRAQNVLPSHGGGIVIMGRGRNRLPRRSTGIPSGWKKTAALRRPQNQGGDPSGSGDRKIDRP